MLYEAPHRVARTLADLAAACGSHRPVVLARELTKLHEEVWRGTLGEAVGTGRLERPPRRARDRRGRRGAGAPSRRPPRSPPRSRPRLASGMDRKTAVAEVTATLGVPKRAVYEAALALKDAGRTP